MIETLRPEPRPYGEEVPCPRHRPVYNGCCCPSCRRVCWPQSTPDGRDVLVGSVVDVDAIAYIFCAYAHMRRDHPPLAARRCSYGPPTTTPAGYDAALVDGTGIAGRFCGTSQHPDAGDRLQPWRCAPCGGDALSAGMACPPSRAGGPTRSTQRAAPAPQPPQGQQGGPGDTDQATITRILHWHTEKVYASTMADRLNAQGVPTLTEEAHWTVKAIRQVLHAHTPAPPEGASSCG